MNRFYTVAACGTAVGSIISIVIILGLGIKNPSVSVVIGMACGSIATHLAIRFFA